MVRWIFLSLLVLADVVSSSAQSKVTTYILLRHAEKADDGTKDPDLSDAGKQRAQHLVSVLKKAKVSAIYSTPFRRTRGTVTPLAKSKGVAIQDYDPAKLEDVLIASKNSGEPVVIICGHSNTTPALLNLLVGSNDYKSFDDGDYGKLIIVSIAEGAPPKIVWKTF